MARKKPAVKPTAPVAEEAVVDESLPVTEAEDTTEELAAPPEEEVAEGESPEEAPLESAEEEAAGEEAPEAEALFEESPEEPVAEVPVAEVPAGIATPDGRGVLPHQVLQAERDQRTAAEAEVQRLQAELQQASARAAELEAKAAAIPTPEVGMEAGGEVAPEPELPELNDVDFSDEEGSTLSDIYELPGSAAALKCVPALVAHVKALTVLVHQMVDLDNRRFQAEQEEEAREQSAQAEAQAREMHLALDNLPLVRHYEVNQPEAWGDFVKFHDDIINKHPEHSKLPHADRFRKALDMAKAIHGDKLGLEDGGKVPQPDVTAAIPAEGEASAETLPDEQVPNEVSMEEPHEVSGEPLKDNGRKLSDAELKAQLKPKPKAVVAKRTTVTIGSVPGGESAEGGRGQSKLQRMGVSAFNKELASAKGNQKEIDRITREWASYQP